MAQCEDKHCPIHGKIKARGVIIEGVVVSDKPKNTIIIQRNYLKYSSKYERYERRKSRIAAHKPGCMKAKVGDIVKIGECRKISKTKSFVLLETKEKKGEKK